MHSLAHFASNTEILLPVCPLQHLIRAAKPSEALPVVPVWSKADNWGGTQRPEDTQGEWTSVLIYWSNFTGALVVLLETSSTVCRCSAGHTGRHAGEGEGETEREKERKCVSCVCACACVFGCPSKTKVEVFFFFGMSSRSKKKKKKSPWNNKISDLNVLLSPPQWSHKAASTSRSGHVTSWILNYCSVKKSHHFAACQ